MSRKPKEHLPAETISHRQLLSQLTTAATILAQPQDGRLQVALAIAGVSSLVTVDPSQIPFVTKPQSLFDLTFDDNKVGLSTDQMPAFWAGLSILLPQIATAIQQAETATNDNPSLPIEQVAQYVRVSLVPTRAGS